MLFLTARRLGGMLDGEALLGGGGELGPGLGKPFLGGVVVDLAPFAVVAGGCVIAAELGGHLEGEIHGVGDVFGGHHIGEAEAGLIHAGRGRIFFNPLLEAGGIGGGPGVEGADSAIGGEGRGQGIEPGEGFIRLHGSPGSADVGDDLTTHVIVGE